MLFKDFGFDNRILKSIDHLGFEEATEIQSRAIPEAMAGRDLLASSKTGSGKTLAYLLPALHRVYKTRALSKRDPRVVVLVPTRELAKQVYSQLRLLLAGSRYSSILIQGGENFNDQHKQLQKDPHFIVATPGRLADHLKQRHVFLEGLELLILDEADRMLDLGFAEAVRAINAAASHRLRQTLFFSATLDNTDVSEIAGELLKEPSRVAIGQGYDEHKDIEQHVYLCDHLDHKQDILKHLITSQTIKQAIVFTATKSDTARLAEMIEGWGLTTQALNGNLSQAARNKVMESFAKGHFEVLVSTDLASRGLDIARVSHVFNFDVPKQAEEFVHRTGRTGRAGFKGDAYSLVGPKDWHNFKAIEAFLQRKFDQDVVEGLEPKFKGLAAAKPARKFDKTPAPSKARKAAKKAPRKAAGKARFHDNKQDGFDAFKLPPKRFPTPVDSGDEEA
ncbi:DEAD/DEAH box helicase [Marinomonas pollencensis]|uniref:Superfamily II DNA/RNA helicase n=1 Tax=Marinomonas pollencensis TaxID=491954 RepID=A0A3E0DUD3_9GAMM|nr:DEAD/DEAH box helicase [Marinomonas pollencensis]REG86518.1 superfamily II DNA/RNA helicase [Marinomonas pollencensis]